MVRRREGRLWAAAVAVGALLGELAADWDAGRADPGGRE